MQSQPNSEPSGPISASMRSIAAREARTMPSERATVSTRPLSMAQKKLSEPSASTRWIERA